MEHALLLTKLEKVLGKSIPTSRGNHSFKCPVCKHRKNKLEINLNTQQYHCWVCDIKGSKIDTLIKKANIHYDLAKGIYALLPKSNNNTQVETSYIKLPDEYKPLYEISLKDILIYNDEPLVSVDFNHTEASSHFDANLTKVSEDGLLVKVFGWYDNEWGFSCRMIDTALAMIAAK